MLESAKDRQHQIYKNCVYNTIWSGDLVPLSSHEDTYAVLIPCTWLFGCFALFVS